MDAFIFTQRYNSLGTAFMVGLGNAKLCNARGRAAPGTSPTHVCDAEGFHYAAGRIRSLYEVSRAVFQYDNGEQDDVPASRRRGEIMAALGGIPDGSLDFVAYFGHGDRGGLISAGIGTTHLNDFAGTLKAKLKNRAAIILYACGAGAPGGFASRLADAFDPASGILVFGHIGPGHYAQIPMFRRYPGGHRLARNYEGRLSLSFWNREREAVHGVEPIQGTAVRR
jgi:hypothetical protein